MGMAYSFPRLFIRMKEASMFRVYGGPPGSDALHPAEKSRHLYKEFTGIDEAMGWAHHLKEAGRVPLLLEGDDGTHLEKRELAKTMHHHGSERVKHGAH
jgi:hypothetical protein